MSALRCDDSPETFTTCLVAAHPDDEVIGAGATVLPHAAPCVVVHVTDGAPPDLADAQRAGCATREAYAVRRRDEAREAIALARSAPCDVIELGIGDQQASHVLAAIARRLAALLRDLRAPVVLTHPYEGGHPDHDATAFGVHAARALLQREGVVVPIVEFTSYHDRDGQTVHSDFLREPGGGAALSFTLTAAEALLKRQLFQCFASQSDVLRWFPIDTERFRVAPDYDFLVPPHPGTVLYERHPWGMSVARWTVLARQARAELGLVTPAPEVRTS